MNLVELVRLVLKRLRQRRSPDTDTGTDDGQEDKQDDEPVDVPTEEPEVEDPPREEHTPPDEEEEETGQTEEEEEDDDDGGGSEEDVNRSSEEQLDIQWPPNPCVDTPHRGVGEETIEVRLYWRVGDELGEWACKMAKPYVEYCYEEAWGKSYEVDCVIHPDPVPIDRDSRDNHGSWYVAFKNYYWNLSSDDRAKHANALIGHLPGVFGEAAGHYCVVNLHKLDSPTDHRPWEEGDCVRERHYGGLGYSINSTLHEIGHCLGLSHREYEPDQDDLVEVYGKSHVTVMNNSYHSGNGRIHVLGDRVRSKEPDLSY
jgi:hypothetical protein